MKFQTRVLTLAIASLSLAACNNPFSGKVDLETDTQKFSYAIGVDIGRSMEPIRDDIDLDALKQGLQDVQEKAELALNDEERKQILTTMAQQLREKKMKEMEAKGKSATDAGAKFLADNGKRAGVTTTASGLQIETLKAGSGAKPSATSVVTVHYKGTLTNGTVFDSSYDRGQPATFPLNQVIPGWTEGVQLMQIGGKYKLYIPGNLAYGPQGSGEKIGPNETLVFEIELLKIEG